MYAHISKNLRNFAVQKDTKQNKPLIQSLTL